MPQPKHKCFHHVGNCRRKLPVNRTKKTRKIAHENEQRRRKKKEKEARNNNKQKCKKKPANLSNKCALVENKIVALNAASMEGRHGAIMTKMQRKKV